MCYEEKLQAFDKAVEKAGLYPAYEKLNNIAEETVGIFLDDMIEEAAKEDTRPVCRIRYSNDADGERYNFEIRQHDEEEFDNGEISDEDIYEMAVTEFGGIASFIGNGGVDKLIGVHGDEETIEAEGDVEFTEYEEE